MRTLLPSVQPNSLSPCRNVATYRCPAGWFSDKWMSTPIRRTRSRCCARNTAGHSTTLPSPAMNSRRLISALQRFAGKPIAIRDALEPVLMAPFGQLCCKSRFCADADAPVDGEGERRKFVAALGGAAVGSPVLSAPAGAVCLISQACPTFCVPQCNGNARGYCGRDQRFRPLRREVRWMRENITDKRNERADRCLAADTVSRPIHLEEKSNSEDRA